MRQINRRSFLGRVAGASALGASAMLAGKPAKASRVPPRRGLCSDTDKGPNADPMNAWVADRDREPGDPIMRPEPNYTDSDAGPNSDPGAPRIGFCGYKARRT
jgi:hypothetical protein